VHTVLLATRNAHKVAEIRALLGAEFRYLTLADLPGAPALPETGATFAENARQKALALAAWVRAQRPPGVPGPGTPVWVLADDSGLEVDALGGRPGVHSARFAALDTGQPENSRDADNNAKLLRLLAGLPAEKRQARFRCAVALVSVWTEDDCGEAVQLFEGTCEGRIGFTPRGEHGFGYDPLFEPEGMNRTFAELGEAEKNRLSHRARALVQARAWLAERRQPESRQS
jgi:XTP/dITP diphosphohydrolase